MEETNNNHHPMMFSEAAKLPESPRLPMEFLSRSWSLPALQLSKALSTSNSAIVPSPFVPKTVSTTSSSSSCTTSTTTPPPILEEDNNSSTIEVDQKNNLQILKQRLISGPHSFSFASSTTSQLVLERIMSQSEVSPMTSGRPSCSEAISNSINDHQIDSPPDITLSPPPDFDYSKFLYLNNTPQPPLPTPRGISCKNGGASGAANTGSKTVGRWLKDRREKKKEETRVQNAQLHASISVAAVAAAIAATTAATAAASSSSSTKKDEQAAMTDMAMASAATLVAARCVEAAEAMGADHDHLASVISSAVNVQSHGDIMTLTAAAATALRGAATLKARTMKEVCNIAAVLPVEKGFVNKGGDSGSCSTASSNGDCGGGGGVGEDFLGLCNEQLLARGSELLKRTRQGDLHWKLVSVYVNKEDEVVLKMKSAHMAGTLTKKKKKVLLDVCKDTRPWPERYMVEGGEDRRYFGLKTVSHRVIEFECKNQKEYYLWTQGVSRLLSVAAEKRKNKF